MTVLVPPRAPRTPSVIPHYIGKPYYAALAQSHIDSVAHMLGHQVSMVANVVFGSTEATSDTWRIAYQAGRNTRAVAICFVPLGYTGSNPTIAVASAETETPVTVQQDVAGVTDLGDLVHPGRYQFLVPVTAATLQELSFTTVNTRLHSMHAWEVPRGDLRGTNKHVDRTYADAGRYITDNVSASDPRGFTALLNAISTARSNMLRHVVNLPFRPGLASAGSGGGTYDYLIGSATHGIRTRARDVRGGASTTMSVRCKVRVSAITGGTTHTIRFKFATGGNIDIAGVNATGWWPGAAIGTAGQSGTIAFGDLLALQATRTAGAAGTVTVDSICVYEDV